VDHAVRGGGDEGIPMTGCRLSAKEGEGLPAIGCQRSAKEGEGLPALSFRVSAKAGGSIRDGEGLSAVSGQLKRGNRSGVGIGKAVEKRSRFRRSACTWMHAVSGRNSTDRSRVDKVTNLHGLRWSY